jgi:RimJ/RimL family protein N-acetyltransferase
MLAYLNHPDMAGQRGLPGRFPTHAPLTVAHVEQVLEGFAEKEDALHLAIVLNGIDTVTGHAGFFNGWDAHSPYLGVTVGPSHDPQIVYTEAYKLLLDYAFTTTVAHSISSSCAEFMTDCITSLKATGFSQAGRRRRAGVHEGAFYDELAFDILRTEWAAHHEKEAATEEAT